LQEKQGAAMSMVSRVVLIAALACAATGTAIAVSVEDDLAVVKRAVARQQVARQEAPAPEPPVADPPITVEKDDAWERRDNARPRTGGRDLRWFKVRITEKGAKKARVNVNVPIALVRALGDDFPIDIGRHGGWRGDWRGGREKAIRLGEVLATLEAGQSLVEIDDEDSTVRIWVE
jgi:hypothetical protein